MVVDDTPSALRLITDLLQREGYHVRPASTGELALRSAFRSVPELILLDVKMPGMDGYEVCRRLKADSRTRDVPVIFLSGLTDSASRVSGLELGAQDFISKPIQAEEVLARVRTHLMLSRAMLALDRMCTDLEQSVMERSTDLDEVSTSLEQLLTAHGETTRRLLLASDAIESAHDAIIITDTEGTILSANAAAVALTGFSRKELVGSSAAALFDTTESGTTARSVLRGHDAARWAGEAWVLRNSGGTAPVWLSLAGFYDPSGAVTHHVAVFSDISRRKAAEARLHYLAEHDDLTGLPNRLLLHDRFVQSVAAAADPDGIVAMLHVDIDQFQTVNETLGHDIGDAYLRALASSISKLLHPTDTLCRLSADEFIILLNAPASVSEVAAIAERIRLRLEAPYDVEGHEVCRSASIGIALYPEDGTDFDDLAGRADTAMHASKETGRNRVLFHIQRMNDELHRRVEMETNLRNGLRNREFFVRYQPQVDLASGRVVGVEALVRWQRPGIGEVLPDEFIAVAEESGMICELGRFVLEHVCHQARTWLDEGISVRMAVNVSPVEIQHGDVDEAVFALLERTGLPAPLLEVEITESSLIDDTNRTSDMIGRLTERGVHLSIDDFLTGYSNFHYLRQFRPAHLKIDRSFVESIARGSEDHAIVCAAIQMANALGIETIAEGIETAEQAQLLREAGCTLGQGYLFARPLTTDDITALLQRERAL
jgi:diguanylate cyclase (GGDEF)-like protein/PAS domain S-box-containing protein